MTFYERYVASCVQQNIKPCAESTAKQIGCSVSSISSFKKSGKTPNGDVVASVAQLLNVSADYLLGLVDTPRSLIDSCIQSDCHLFTIFNQLNEAGTEAALSMLSGLIINKAYKKIDANNTLGCGSFFYLTRSEQEMINTCRQNSEAQSAVNWLLGIANSDNDKVAEHELSINTDDVVGDYIKIAKEQLEDL